MLLEIKNLDRSEAKNSFQGTFDVVIREIGLVIAYCKLFENEKSRWIEFPQKFKKKADGTWDKPDPYAYFLDYKLDKVVKSLIMDEIDKTEKKLVENIKNEVETNSIPLIHKFEDLELELDIPF